MMETLIATTQDTIYCHATILALVWTRVGLGLGLGVRVGVRARVKVRKMYLFDQDARVRVKSPPWLTSRHE